MIWKSACALALAITMVSAQASTLDQDKNQSRSIIQQISITNMLWNPNGTGGAAGLTQTSVVAAFNNGGSHPCYTTTLAFQGFINVQVGTGQACVAAVTSVSLTPVAGPAGTVYAAPSDVSINGLYFTNQIITDDNTDPVFDTTNGAVKTQGTVHVAYQGQ